MTRVLMVAVLSQETWCTPGHTQQNTEVSDGAFKAHTQGFTFNQHSMQTIN